MFVVGLLVGPALGLVAGIWLLRSRSLNLWVVRAGIVVVMCAVLFVPVVDLELRLGVAGGLLLGLLLAATAEPSETPDAVGPNGG